jgi:hypothetical protein
VHVLDADDQPPPEGGQGDKEARRQGEGEFRLDPDSPINNPQAAPRREVCRLDETGRSLVRAAMQGLQIGGHSYALFWRGI